MRQAHDQSAREITSLLEGMGVEDILLLENFRMKLNFEPLRC